MRGNGAPRMAGARRASVTEDLGVAADEEPERALIWQYGAADSGGIRVVTGSARRSRKQPTRARRRRTRPFCGSSQWPGGTYQVVRQTDRSRADGPGLG